MGNVLLGLAGCSAGHGSSVTAVTYLQKGRGLGELTTQEEE